jgi:outer membrane lipoprotein SlyB
MSTEPTTTERRPRRTTIRAGIGIVAMTTAAVAGVSIASAAATSAADTTETIEVDIAEDGTRFVIDEAPVFDDGFPAHGNAFITQGYIYPAGTLTDSNGVNPDGTPEFPDEVIGEWSCSGYFIGEGAHATEGAWVFTTQLFAFGDDADTGAETIVVTGYEGAEVGAIVTGAITGGTGDYATASGAADQELLGINNPDLPTMGINKTVELTIERG